MIWTPHSKFTRTVLKNRRHLVADGARYAICGEPRGGADQVNASDCDICMSVFRASRRYGGALRFRASLIDSNVAHVMPPQPGLYFCGVEPKGFYTSIRVETGDDVFFVQAARPYRVLDVKPCAGCQTQEDAFIGCTESNLEAVRWSIRNPPADGEDATDRNIERLIEICVLGRHLTPAERTDPAALAAFAQAMAVFAVLCPEMRRLNVDPSGVRWPLVFHALTALQDLPHIPPTH